MNEDLLSFDDSELSAEDLAVLQAFDAMDDWPVAPLEAPTSAPGAPVQVSSAQGPLDMSSEDMLLIFVTEIDADITTMHLSLNQLEQEAQIIPARFMAFHRLGHKIRGSAGAIECHSIARIAQHIEEIADQIVQGTLFPVIGINALTLALSALKATLESIITSPTADNAPLTKLEEELEILLMERNTEIDTAEAHQDTHLTEEPVATHSTDTTYAIPSLTQASIDLAELYTRVDTQRLAHLLLHSEQLATLRMPLENAQAQVESALEELHAAQIRVTQIEPLLFASLTTAQSAPPIDNFPMSSLMARILNKAGYGNDMNHPRYVRKSRPRSRSPRVIESSTWDRLDIEHYTEQDLLLNSLREAITDINVASSRVRVAFAHLRLTLQEYTTQATTVRNDTLVLHLVPLSLLIPRLQQVITTNATAQNRFIHFDVAGDDIGIDQQILDTLAPPLLQLLQTCSIDIPQTHPETSLRIWLHAQEIGNEIAIEVGFSVAVNGGAVEPLRAAMQRLSGTLALQRNSENGVSFHLRLPRSQGTTRCLLVSINDQQIIVPFSQVQRIGDSKREHFDRLYSLNNLLGYPVKPVHSERIQPTLTLLQRASPISIGIMVDEIIDEVNLVVKPLASYLQRPGMSNAAIDGKGRVLQMVDLPELVRHYMQVQYIANKEITREQDSKERPKILVADDSVYLRNTVVHILEREGYIVLQARDGLEALEQLEQNTPDVFLLDIEMPNLNGYDLLDIMHLYPSLMSVKIIMLTSRSSEKHRQHALALGAHAYLVKPCSQELLIETIRTMLKN